MTTILIIDLFCGAGGVSEGFEQASVQGVEFRVLAGVNHDAKAIESHAANHPDTHHFTEDIRKRLEGIGLAMPNTSFEIYADYDQRVKGHIDGMTNKGNQIYEIKSCVQAQLDFIRNNGDKLPKRHFNQVQAYMHHGRFKSCLMVYVARDTGEIWTKEVFYLPVVGASIEQKAKSVLKMYDDALLKNKY